MTGKLITVRQWAENNFETLPHPNTLMRWIQAGKIAPRPKKIGKQYFCTPEARYVDPVADKINRLAAGK